MLPTIPSSSYYTVPSHHHPTTLSYHITTVTLLLYRTITSSSCYTTIISPHSTIHLIMRHLHSPRHLLSVFSAFFYHIYGYDHVSSNKHCSKRSFKHFFLFSSLYSSGAAWLLDTCFGSRREKQVEVPICSTQNPFDLSSVSSHDVHLAVSLRVLFKKLCRGCVHVEKFSPCKWFCGRLAPLKPSLWWLGASARNRP